MNKNCTPQELAEIILNRSVCMVQVGAVLSDNWNIFGWGWNSMGSNGLGLHAEVHCLQRSNKNRFSKATLWVASVRRRNHKIITSKPCDNCQGWIAASGIQRVFWRNEFGVWCPL